MEDGIVCMEELAEFFFQHLEKIWKHLPRGLLLSILIRRNTKKTDAPRGSSNL